MDTANESLETLQDIKRMMERSSRFISLSGWSGISAGACGLAGAWVAVRRLTIYKSVGDKPALVNDLIILAGVVFCVALVSAFLFTWLRSRKTGIVMWGVSSRRLLWNTALPMVAGGLVILRILHHGYYLLVAPCCLIFYGLALINGSKYTLGEVRYLGYGQLILGIACLWVEGYGLIFWAVGFGLLHIIYGAWMWWKYERSNR